MIYAGGSYQHRVLFVAREAARRFRPLRIKTKSRRNAWQPLALRWRRMRKLADRAASRAAGIVQTFPSFSQLHFHFSTYLTERLQRLIASSPSVPVRKRPVAIDRTSGDVHPSSHPLQFDRPVRPLWLKSAEPDSKPIFNWKTIVRNTTQFHHSKLFTPAIVYRPESLLAGPGLIQQRRHPGRPERAEPPTRSRVLENTLRIFSVRTQTIGDHVHGQSRDRKVSELSLHSPEELVWRRSPRRQLEVDDGSQAAETVAGAVQRPNIRTVPFQEPTAAVGAEIRTPAVPTITKLESGLVDRL